MAYTEDDSRPDKDVHVRNHFDRMTRAYLRSVLSDEVIEEHRTGDVGNPSEPLSRLLAWCQRRPLTEQYAVKDEADGTFWSAFQVGAVSHPVMSVTNATLPSGRRATELFFATSVI